MLNRTLFCDKHFLEKVFPNSLEVSRLELLHKSAAPPRSPLISLSRDLHDETPLGVYSPSKNLKEEAPQSTYRLSEDLKQETPTRVYSLYGGLQ